MGACYSNNAAEAADNNHRLRPRKKDSKRDKKRSKEHILVPQHEICADIQHNGNHSSKTSVAKNSSSLPASVVNPTEIKVQLSSVVRSCQDEPSGTGSGDTSGVAPSDSGIESLATLSDECQVRNNATVVSRKQSKLSRQLERLSRGSCHKCGNFQLDNSALTMLLADTYCKCGPRQAGKPTINPECQAHGKRSTPTPSCPSSPRVPKVSSDSSPIKPSLRLPGQSNDGCQSVRISIQSTDSLEQALSVLVRSGSTSSCDEAPLAPGETSDTLPRRLSKLRVSGLSASSKSLLTSILDITDSVCKCEFYSNEICCSPTHNNDNDNNNGNISTEASKKAEPLISEHDFTSCKLTSSSPAKSLQNGYMYPPESNSLSNVDTSKKYASLPKFVSFAPRSEIQLKARYISPTKLKSLNSSRHSSHIESNVSTADSGVLSQHSYSASESYLNGVFKLKGNRTITFNILNPNLHFFRMSAGLIHSTFYYVELLLKMLVESIINRLY